MHVVAGLEHTAVHERGRDGRELARYDGEHRLVEQLETGKDLPLLDERAATVAAKAGEVVTLDLGLDESREGWRYRGALVRIGSAFSWTNDRYEASGTVLSMTLADSAR